jgi:4-amino-4-deoxy-L-arabinose transferase-like glycosyltransferase
VLVAALIWWRARSSGFFFVVGLEGSTSANLGPLLPALCAGLSAAAILLIADAAAGAVAGAIAVLLMVCLPGFVALHLDSLTGPPLLAVTLLMAGTMMHAPRFSLAYGTLGAVGGLFVATEGIGLPLAAAAWALVQRARGAWQRMALALAPTAIFLLLAHLLGGAWPHGVVYQWRGGLDRSLRAAGTIIGNQMSPTISNPALRFLVIADLALVILAVIVVGWRRIGRPADESASVRRVYPVTGLLSIALVIGLAGRTLLVQGAPEPGLPAVMPLAVLTVLVLVVSIAGLWHRWPRWGKAVALVLLLGWLQAAVRA